MDTTQQQVDAEIGDNDTEECCHAPDVETDGGMVVALAHVQRVEIDQQGDERPHFLGVPRPVVAPRDVGPYRPDDDSQGELRHGGIEHQQVGTFHSLPQSRPDESRHSACHGKEEECIGCHDDRYMQREQRRAKHRHEVGHRRVGAAHHSHKQTESHILVISRTGI